jgi:hypothetical protein
MAAVLGWSDTLILARLCIKRQSGNSRDAVARPPLGSPCGAAIVGYLRLRGFWRSLDAADSV